MKVRSVTWKNELALRLDQVKTENKKQKPISISLIGILLRNAWFMVWIILHEFRRLLPP